MRFVPRTARRSFVPRQSKTTKLGDRGLKGVPGFNGSNGVQGLQGIRGVPGFNGSEGKQGIPGPPGSGNLSACNYKADYRRTTPSKLNRIDDLIISETKDRKYIGVSCSTDVAPVCNLTSGLDKNNVRWFKCYCAGTLLAGNIGTLPSVMNCYIHYWDCPLIS
ncbi:hypothetical protein AC249_AIPGENE15085 [Exaiptasia diaphana]|nr:hypothetical protein AC249_AIPGENE15085 [Exaiptasia diaphana]